MENGSFKTNDKKYAVDKRLDANLAPLEARPDFNYSFSIFNYPSPSSYFWAATRDLELKANTKNHAD